MKDENIVHYINGNLFLFLGAIAPAENIPPPPTKKPKAEGENVETDIANMLYDSTAYLVQLSGFEKAAAEKKLADFKGGDLAPLFNETWQLQRCDHLLPVRELHTKYPWLPKVRSSYL